MRGWGGSRWRRYRQSGRRSYGSVSYQVVWPENRGYTKARFRLAPE